jgi:hypothetical protein
MQSSIGVRTSWARHWKNNSANELSVREGRELCLPRREEVRWLPWDLDREVTVRFPVVSARKGIVSVSQLVLPRFGSVRLGSA